MNASQSPTLKAGTTFLHRRFKVRVIAIRRDGLLVQRVNTGLSMTLPWSQIPQHAYK